MNGKTITFGHGGRHLDGANLSDSQVQNAILQDVLQNIPDVGKSMSRIIIVDGAPVEYRSFNRGENVINVGTYFIKE